MSLLNKCTILLHGTERRHGSTRVPGHAFLAWSSSWRMAVYNITAAGNSISSQLGSSCHGNRYGAEKASDTARPLRKNSHLSGYSSPVGQAGPPCWASPLSFGLIGLGCQCWTSVHGPLWACWRGGEGGVKLTNFTTSGTESEFVNV